MFGRYFFVLWVVALVGVTAGPLAATAADSLDLSGTWRYALDRSNEGVRQEWFKKTLEGEIRFPASLAVNRIGDPVTMETKWTGGTGDGAWYKSPRYTPYREADNLKISFWLQPETVYVAPAWYQREIEIPAGWDGGWFELLLERPHIATTVWLDDKEFGTQNSLGTAHRYELGAVRPGKHVLTIRVDNRILLDVGRGSHSISDHTQGNWNGIVGKVELRRHDPIWIERQRITASNSGVVTIEARLRNELFDPVSGTVQATLCDKATGEVVGKGAATFDLPRGIRPDGSHIVSRTADVKIEVKLDKPPKLWSEFQPALYLARTRLDTDKPKHGHAVSDTFGFREIATEGTQFTLNGQKIFIRGTLECCIFPKTGHPPTDAAEWKRILGVAKSHGLNLLRFHSWCPPEAAFEAADELGVYFQVECSSWTNSTTGLGQGKPIDAWLYDEARRMLAAYGNHPSFLLMLYGNEPVGKDREYLGKWVETFKAEDPRRLYSSGSGWPLIPQNQFHVTPKPRIQAWGQGLRSRINSRPPETQTDYRDFIGRNNVPVISHEIGQWCVYPNFDEMAKYTGHLKPKNFEIFRDFLAAAGMADQAKAFLHASGKLQTLCYKEEIEAALRTPGMGGFELLDLHDFPGQGTALVGVLDPFWESKGYVTAAEYSRFCNSTVPLARLAKRVFTADETLKAALEVAHFGSEPLKDIRPKLRLVDDEGKTVAEETMPPRDIPIGNGIALGEASFALEKLAAPRRYRLVLSLEGSRFENDWDVWVYPQKVALDVPEGVLWTDRLDAKARAALSDGGRVVWALPPERVRKPAGGAVAMGFSSIFWNTAWTGRQPPHTLGILCDPAHPLFAEFPTDGFSNWQWWYLVTRAAPMTLDDLPKDFRPTVQVIDDWFTCHRLALAAEAAVGKGRLLVTSVDLSKNLESDPVVRQFRASLLRYAASERFQPKAALTFEQAAGLSDERSE